MLTHYKSSTILAVSSLFFACLGLFLWGQTQQEIVGFESRFYLFALEMWRNGLALYPTTYSQPYPDYPVTFTTLIYLCSLLAGDLNRLTAVFPSAMAATLTVTMTYLIVKPISQRWGVAAVCFLLMTVAFLKASRAVSLDIFPAMITTCCVYVMLHGSIRYKNYLVYLLLFAGFLFRGPIGLVIPAAVLWMFFLLEGDYKSLLRFSLCAGALLFTAMVSTLLLAYFTQGVEFMQAILRMQAVGRLEQHTIPYYFYFTNSLQDYALAYPLALIVILISLVKKNYQPILKFMAWAFVILIGMSIPGGKKIRYLLPMVPALALIAAYPYAQVSRFSHLLTRIFVFLPGLIIIGVALLSHYRVIAIPSVFPILTGLQVVMGFAFYFFKSQRDIVILALATITFLFAYITIFEPLNQYAEKSKTFITTIEQLRTNQHRDLVFYKAHPDGWPIKYMIYAPAVTPRFLQTEKELLALSHASVIILNQENFEQLSAMAKLKLTVLANEQAAHMKMIVLTGRKA